MNSTVANACGPTAMTASAHQRRRSRRRSWCTTRSATGRKQALMMRSSRSTICEALSCCASTGRKYASLAHSAAARATNSVELRSRKRARTVDYRPARSVMTTPAWARWMRLMLSSSTANSSVCRA
ncbi:MAG: amidoligase family protein [Candidatus Dormibacteraeota bacterium]|nr:amidoligase family protein [Candidatus Dormibacteraeota bacterium]